ncbi:unnamed protein product [Hyaloperonospora brassicae]|uniref:Cysteine-rich protein n=1 Tax=Hyaloperonospora brassicae TaxID=162125 RepID=A0AAV0TA58_HYABA|nr:unnamed protein product [Hyaloperonospora brassicae]
MCECHAADADKCQNPVNPNATSGTVAHFGECSDQLQCVDSYGYIATSQEKGPVCAERLHCLQEMNSEATQPASICHTCMSCIVQNHVAEKQLAAAKRFNSSGAGDKDNTTTRPENATTPRETSGSSMVKPQTNIGAIAAAIVAVVLVAALN